MEHDRPEPPDYLTPDESAEWNAIVPHMPADFFTEETWPLLVAYCQHIVTAKELSEQIRNMPLSKNYKELKVRGLLQTYLIREHRAMVVLATKLRLTPISRMYANNETPKQNEITAQPTIRPSFQVEEMDYAAA
jgi:phage terminase small subunit